MSATAGVGVAGAGAGGAGRATAGASPSSPPPSSALTARVRATARVPSATSTRPPISGTPDHAAVDQRSLR